MAITLNLHVDIHPCKVGASQSESYPCVYIDQPEAYVTIHTPDRETADILASAFQLCADRVRQKNAAEREAA